jgi:hypothetical protein
MDHWNVFMMEREKDDLGEMEHNSLAGTRLSNLGGAGPNGKGGIELTKNTRRDDLETKMNLFFLENVSFVSIKLCRLVLRCFRHMIN